MQGDLCQEGSRGGGGNPLRDGGCEKKCGRVVMWVVDGLVLEDCRLGLCCVMPVFFHAFEVQMKI